MLTTNDLQNQRRFGLRHNHLMSVDLLSTFEDLSASKHQILFFSRFHPSSGHGGCRRTSQVLSALNVFNLGFLCYEDFTFLHNELYSKFINRSCSVSHILNSLTKRQMTNGLYSKWSPLLRDYLLSLNYIASKWSKCLSKLSNLRLVIVDDPIYFEPVVRQCSKLGLKVVAHCHNIETLSAPQVLATAQHKLFAYELELLSTCDAVISISREETFLLRNLGINVIYFPYYPVGQIETRMRAVRTKRQGNAKKNFLLLGTAANLPTRIGMTKVIEAWQRISIEGADKLIVAGYDTESLRKITTTDKFEFKGAMTDDELDVVLSTVKGCLIFQENGSGALTKIAEYLIAGVPVVSNSHAARSYYDCPGVIEYDDLSGLAEATSICNQVRSFPSPVDHHMKTLSSYVLEILSNTSGI